MVKWHHPMFLLVISKTQVEMDNFLKVFKEFEDVIVMPNDSSGPNTRWHFIRNAMNDRKRIVLYPIVQVSRKLIEEQIEHITYHITSQNNLNIQRVLLDDGLI